MLKKDTITYDFDNHFNSLSNDYSAGFPTLPIRPYVIGIKAIAANFTTFTVNRYEISSAWVKKKMMKTTNYLTNSSNGIDEITNYTYDTNYKHTNPTIINVNSSDFTMETSYQYAPEQANTDMIAANMLGIPLQTEAKENGKIISKTKTVYAKNALTGNLILPVTTQKFDKDNSASPKNTVEFNQYDAQGNMLQYTTKGSVPTAVIWGYNNVLPIAKIEGATYQEAVSFAGEMILKSNEDIDADKEKALMTAMDAYRNQNAFKNYNITTYTYDPLIGITSVTPPTGLREFYKYDAAGRLQSVVDVNNNIIKELKYNYKQ
ncbi:YD repeat-containing protein [Chryseobacterium sp. YR221]|nr:YD repeat-containing protein [Chryseobacterium sp. YR221]